MIAGQGRVNNDTKEGKDKLKFGAGVSVAIQILFMAILASFVYRHGAYKDGVYHFTDKTFATETFSVELDKSVAIPFFTLEPVDFGDFYGLAKVFREKTDTAGFNAAGYANVKAIEDKHCPAVLGRFCTCWSTERAAFATANMNDELEYTTDPYNAAGVDTHFTALEGCIYEDTLWAQKFAGFKIPVKMFMYWLSLSIIVLLMGTTDIYRSVQGVIVGILVLIVSVLTVTSNMTFLVYDSRNAYGGAWSMLLETFVFSMYIITLLGALYDYIYKSAQVPFLAQAMGKYNIIFGFPAFHYIALVYIFHYNEAKNLFFIWLFYVGVAVLLVQLAQFRYQRDGRDGYSKLGAAADMIYANSSFAIMGNVLILSVYFIISSTLNVMQYNVDSFGWLIVLLPIITLFVEFGSGWLNLETGRYVFYFFLHYS